MRKTNKKGFVFELSLVFVTFILLVTIVVQVNSRLQVFKEVVGKEAFDVLEANLKIRAEKFRYHRLGKYALYNAIYDFAAAGGKNTDECGKEESYVKWTHLTDEEFKNCMPVNYVSDFNLTFTDNFNELLLTAMPAANNKHEFSIDYDLEENKLSVDETTRGSLEMEYKPNALITDEMSLNAAENYNLGVYGKLIALSKSLLAKCGTNQTEELKKCIEPVIAVFNDANKLSVNHEIKQRTAKFDLDQSDIFPYVNADNIELKKPRIKFALDIGNISSMK